MLKEFREFINRGNLIDLAVAFVMGVAFAGVVTALTERIVGPIIGTIFRLNSLENVGTFANGSGSVGAFIQAILNFIIIAFVMFLVVKAYNKMKAPAPEEAPAAPAEDVVLLREIRDALQK